MVVNTIVVFEIFYLFNVRYLHAASISLRGSLGTPAVLLAVVAVILAQMAFTYLPAMQAVFDSRSGPPVDGIGIVTLGVGLMVLLELGKTLLRGLGILRAIGGCTGAAWTGRPEPRRTRTDRPPPT